MAQLHDIETWVFDLDNTLYPPDMALFPQVNAKMAAYVCKVLGVTLAEANALRREYYLAHGTTLAGLMLHHGVDPDPYLLDVHNIDFSVLSPDPALAEAIKALPGRKIVYTNGTAPYAEAVAHARGLDGLFDAIYGVEHADYHPKPSAEAFDTVFGKVGLTPTRAAMFEDEARNLRVPHGLGLTTIHVAPVPEEDDFIHHGTDDLTGFLQNLPG
ncbi:pyrimidine 5'-nucleotidase [Gymnodinialimonas ceratoperidinii]|uniref:Pyrimidine 5'-nucleotidase n=1 Tax=Gymnodinialimonas ceratoperidinii TaxID=2856823 RepID=A0A8F6YCE3_9RHOB|nr:pyrimidine 5'-nucleotidase [Gymnodinialimonas ceratoperidinii]QXT39127.1 pyrimidine 5'-nucleotidase [Gymnodinialimonas ceratoperidinii]